MQMAWKCLVRSLLAETLIGQQQAGGWVGVGEVPSGGAAARPAAGWRGIAGSVLSTGTPALLLLPPACLAEHDVLWSGMSLW